MLSVTAQKTEVFVTAHPDDWQLFMNPSAYYAIQAKNTKVIFLHMTAGDAGKGTDDGYFSAREEGSLRAVRFLCNLHAEQGAGSDMAATSTSLNQHRMFKFSYANTVSYFLRLPDGNFKGPGFPKHDHQSLERLFTGKVSSLTSIDGGTTYSSVDDLINTISTLLRFESRGNEITLHIAETDSIANPEDHSDHRFSSHLLQKVAESLNVRTIKFYQEYATKDKESNLSEEEFLVNVGTWGATVSGLTDKGNYSTWDDTHNQWLSRQYFREEKRK